MLNLLTRPEVFVFLGMCRTYLLILALAFCTVVSSQNSYNAFPWLEQSPKTTISRGDLKIPVVNFEGLYPLLHQSGDKIRVVNFWATWCAPCIKELPYFESLGKEYASKGVEVVLVSLDFPSMWEKRLPDFVEKKGISSPVVVLDDPDQNSWIPRVDANWSGAIPATLIYSADRRQFYEKTFDKASLRKAIDSFIH